MKMGHSTATMSSPLTTQNRSLYIIDHQELLQEIRWEDMGDFGIAVDKVALVQTAEGKSRNSSLGMGNWVSHPTLH